MWLLNLHVNILNFIIKFLFLICALTQGILEVSVEVISIDIKTVIWLRIFFNLWLGIFLNLWL